MMLLVFAALLAAFVAGRYGPQWLALMCIVICLALSVGLFLFEIYNPEYGFRMPWLQVQLDGIPRIAVGART